MTKELESLSGTDFLAAFGGVYEDSSWVADAVWKQSGGQWTGSIKDLESAMRRVVDIAPREQKLALICAHPDLAGRAARAGRLTAASTSEQVGAGLDQCSGEEYSEFQKLNRQYREKFGFPFIIAVAGLHRSEILGQFRIRVGNDPKTEFENALEQIHQIACNRLETWSRNE